jgi:glycosyltransferase involved in cell wall biosynthesis
MKSVSIICPVVRPANIPAILEAVEKAVSCEHEVVWEEDKERIGAPRMVGKLVEKTKYDRVCFLGDDTIPLPGSIDKALAMMEEKDAWLVGLNDQHSPGKATHWIADKKLLDHLENREFFFTGYFHNRCDVELQLKATRLGKYAWCKDAEIIHNHPSFGTAPMDEHYKRGPLDEEKRKADEELFRKRNPKIAVAMIVKNESSCLATCLETVKWADAIYIEDTGSADDTVEIARRYTPNVSFRQWTDHFADARNSVKAKVPPGYDWIISIDADERLLSTEEEVRLAIEKAGKAHSIEIQMEGGGTSAPFLYPRIFRNIPEVRWSGAVHNGLIASSKSVSPDIHIVYGYSDAHKLDPGRAMRILLKEYAKDPNNTRVAYYYGRELTYVKKWKEAIEVLEKYVARSSFEAEKADARYLLAKCYWYTGQGWNARLNCFYALNINPNFAGAAKLMAEYSWPKNRGPWLDMAKNATNAGVLFVR